MNKVVFIAFAGLLLYGCNESSVEEKARRIHDRVFTVDSHTDSPWYLLRGGFDMAVRHDYEKDGSRLDFIRMKEGSLDAVFFAAFVGQRERTEEGNRKAKERVLATIDSIHAHLEFRTETAGLALSPDDAFRLEKEGKRAIFIGIENGYAIGADLENINEFYKKGARYITLCHTRNNDICDSSTDSTELGGLSEFGAEVVHEMNELGMMIDVSHISDSSFYQVLRISSVPVIASHSSARAICDSPRNLSDTMLSLLAINGGVAQVCILSDYIKTPVPYPERDSAFKSLKEKYGRIADLTPVMEKKYWAEWDSLDAVFPRELATVSEAVDHIDHIVNVAGIDHVGIGTDFDGGGGLADCVDVSQLWRITLELVKRGYGKDDIRKIWGGNLMRVMKEVQKNRVSNPGVGNPV